MWLNIVLCASRYGHYLHYRVKNSYRYVKWKLLKGRYANDFYVQIWALNPYMWWNQGLCSVITQFWFIKLICLQFTCTFGGTSHHLSFLNLQARMSQHVTLDIASNSMHETSLNVQNMGLLLNLQQKQAKKVVQIGFPHTGNVTQHCTLCKQVWPFFTLQGQKIV